MVQIRLEVDGVPILDRNLRLLSTNIKNLSPFYQEAVSIVEQSKNDIFNTAWTAWVAGEAWKELAPSTKKAREKRRGYYKKQPNRPSTLRRTGNLQDKIKTIITDQFGSFEMLAPYAIYHQRGGKNLPARKILDPNEKIKQKIVKALQSYINDQIRIFGLQA